MPSRYQPEGAGARAGMGSSVAGSVPSVAPSRTDSVTGTGLGALSGVTTLMKDRSNVSMSVQSPAPTSSSWWAMPGSHRGPVVVLQGLLKKRGGRINSWTDRWWRERVYFAPPVLCFSMVLVRYHCFGVVQSPAVNVCDIVKLSCFSCIRMDAYGGFWIAVQLELMRRSVGSACCCFPVWFCYYLEGI